MERNIRRNDPRASVRVERFPEQSYAAEELRVPDGPLHEVFMLLTCVIAFISVALTFSLSTGRNALKVLTIFLCLLYTFRRIHLDREGNVLKHILELIRTLLVMHIASGDISIFGDLLKDAQIGASLR
jgi:hypothetical protein